MTRIHTGLSIAALIGAAILFATAARAQLAPVPSPAPGLTRIAGDVSVTNRPTVLARQDGEWTVACVHAAVDMFAPRPVVAAGQRVTITYVDGETETVQVTAARQDGWIAAGTRQINLANAISVEPQ